MSRPRNGMPAWGIEPEVHGLSSKVLRVGSREDDIR